MNRIPAVLSAAFAICICHGASAATWYVDGSVSHVGDGQSWETAFKYIQTGISRASVGDTVILAPCVDAGSNSVLNPPGFDMDGNLQIAPWKYPIVPIVDMGAYEYNSRPFAVTHFDFVTVPWPGGRHLVWNSQPSHTYSVWMRYGLQTTGWHKVSTLASEGETTSFTDPGLLIWNWRSVFYRVEME